MWWMHSRQAAHTPPRPGLLNDPAGARGVVPDLAGAYVGVAGRSAVPPGRRAIVEYPDGRRRVGPVHSGPVVLFLLASPVQLRPL